MSIYTTNNMSSNGGKGVSKLGGSGCYEVIYPLLANGNNVVCKGNKLTAVADLKRRRDKHGPNLPVLFTYDLNDEIMQIDIMASI